MARKPIHLQAAGKLTPRDRIWAVVRKLRIFGFAMLCDQIIHDAPEQAETRRINETTIQTYLQQLVRGGFVTVAHAEHKARNSVISIATYSLAKDVGIEAPRLNAKGQPVTQGSVNENLWRAMRVLRQFDHRELVTAATTDEVKISPVTAHGYCLYLARAKYLTVVRPAKPGAPAVYRLAQYTGPLAPQIQRVKHVYDPNIGQVVWHPERDQ